MTWKKMAVIGIFAFVLEAPGVARAGDLVQNGDFSAITGNGGQPNAVVGTTYGIASATDWSFGTGNAAIYAPGGADAIGALDNTGARLYLWGPHNPAPGGNSANGLPASSPAGGNFWAADGDAGTNPPLTQTITGLTPGQTYELTFYYAAAQFREAGGANFNGASTDYWSVDLGDSPAQDTTPLTIASHGFSGWLPATFTFVADKSSELLSFMAEGSPFGVPPADLLSDVSLQSIPEPSTLALMAFGLTGLGAVYLRRRTKSAAV